MDSLDIYIDKILNKYNITRELKELIKQKAKFNINYYKFNNNKKKINYEIKYFYNRYVKILSNCINKKIRLTTEIDYLDMEVMIETLTDFINKYILTSSNKSFNLYLIKIFKLLHKYNYKKFTLEKWLTIISKICDEFNTYIDIFIINFDKYINIAHTNINKKQLENLLINYMNKFDYNNNRLELYTGIDDNDNNLLDANTSILKLSKHIYFKTYSETKYTGQIALSYDLIHLICKLVLIKLKNKS